MEKHIVQKSIRIILVYLLVFFAVSAPQRTETVRIDLSLAMVLFLAEGLICIKIFDFLADPYYVVTQVRANNFEKVKYLVEKKKADINEIHDGYSPLNAAIESNNLEIFTYLLEKGADFNLKTENVPSPLKYALKKQRVKFAKKLLEYSLEKGNQSEPKNVIFKAFSEPESIVYEAVKGGYKDIVELLLKNGCNPDGEDEDDEKVPLVEAAAKGDLEMIKLLCKYKADPTKICYKDTGRCTVETGWDQQLGCSYTYKHPIVISYTAAERANDPTIKKYLLDEKEKWNAAKKQEW